jgi:hypothetical protein
MLIYQTIILGTKGKKDEDGNTIEEQTTFQLIEGTIITLIYSAIVMLFGMAYKTIAYRQTDDENHQYQKNFDDALINRLFIFNSLNFYVPMLYVAFDPRNNAKFDDLFSLLLS